MSEILTHYKKHQLEWKLSLSSLFVMLSSRLLNNMNFFFVWRFLGHCYTYGGKILEDTAITATYIDLLNSIVVDECYMVERDCERVKKHKLCKSCYETRFFADRAVIVAILNSLDILLFRSLIRYTVNNC